MADRILLKPVEAGDALGICRSKIYELLSRGVVPCVRIDGMLRVPVDALREWVNRQLAAHSEADDVTKR